MHTLWNVCAWVGVAVVGIAAVALVAWLCFRNYDWERGG